MEESMRYIIETGLTLPELVDRVSQRCQEGFVPHGDIVIDPDWETGFEYMSTCKRYLQPMIKGEG